MFTATLDLRFRHVFVVFNMVIELGGRGGRARTTRIFFVSFELDRDLILVPTLQKKLPFSQILDIFQHQCKGETS